MRVLLVAAAISSFLVSPAAAQPCPDGNLLAGRRPWAWQDIRGPLTRPTDGVAAPEGAAWDAPLATILDTGAATLTWDLGAVLPLQAAWIQADANDRYTLWGSLDGASFRAVGTVDPVSGHGLRGRKLALGGAPVRYLRFGEGDGDDLYSLSELQVFCRLPAVFPPALPVGDARPAPLPNTLYRYWNDVTSARWELVLALLGLALLTGGHRLGARWRDRLLATLGVLAALSYVNFGAMHFGAFIHDHEWTHYYLGAKYFPEVGYERLYHCLSTADAETSPALHRRVERRKITNLRSNTLEQTGEVLAHPERCRDHFTPARWQAFKDDAAFFRNRQSARRWDAVQVDHGYNATPLWTVAGRLLASTGPASRAQLYTLALLDPLYLVATIAVIGWAFGWRILAVALLVFATNFPSRFYWTGGSFLRWDWLFYTVAAVCLLRKDRPLGAGAAAAYAIGLRIFPVFALCGPALALGWSLLGRRPPDPRLRRFLAGAVLSGALFFGISLAVTGGPASYGAFLRNTFKHEGTAMTNNMGLPTVLAWRPFQAGRHLVDNRAVEPWGAWKQARAAAARQSRPLWITLVLGHLALLALCARHAAPWVLLALSLTLIATGVELLSYYYAFVLAVALLHAQRPEVGRWLLGLTAFTGFFAWAPLPGMSSWWDEQYTAMAAATVGVLALLLWRFRAASPPDAGAARSAGAR